MRLGIYTQKTTTELIDSYELASTDLGNLHKELAEVLSNLHAHYLEIYANSNGKSVAEKNREADYQTRNEYAEVLSLRGQINSLVVMRDMVGQLLNLRKLDDGYEYPPDKDKGEIGYGNR